MQTLRQLAQKVRSEHTISAVATFYPSYTKVYEPFATYTKNIDNVEYQKHQYNGKTHKEIMAQFIKNLPTAQRADYISAQKKAEIEAKDEQIKRSLYRSKRNISDLTICNNFDLFVTFTFNQRIVNRYDIDKLTKITSKWLNNQAKLKGRFDWLVIPELHQDGALHFHALFKGYNGELKESGHKSKDGKRIIYNLPNFKYGFSTAEKIAGEQADLDKVASYIKKYITKDMPRIGKGRKRYWHSNGLKKPLYQDNPTFMADNVVTRVWLSPRGVYRYYAPLRDLKTTDRNLLIKQIKMAFIGAQPLTTEEPPPFS